jgi:hypothetical protein
MPKRGKKMSKPHIIELPDRQGVGVRPGEVILRFHQSGHYLFPFGTENVQQHPGDFACPNCGAHVQWLLTKKGSSVFSCHCLVAVFYQPDSAFTVDCRLWINWIAEAWTSEQAQRQIQAN